MSRPRRQSGLRGRRLRLEHCESRCVLSATTGAATADTVNLDTVNQDLAGDYLQVVALSGWTQIDDESQLVTVAEGSNRLTDSYLDTAISAAWSIDLSAGIDVTADLLVADSIVSQYRFSDLEAASTSTLSIAIESDQAPLFASAALTQRTVNPGGDSDGLLDDGFSQDQVVTDTGQGTVDLGLLDDQDIPVSTPQGVDATGVTNAVSDAGQVELTVDGASEPVRPVYEAWQPLRHPGLRSVFAHSDAEQPVLPRVAESIVRAQSSVGELQRVVPTPTPPAGATAPDAGMIDLAGLLLTPAAEAAPISLTAATAPRETARDAALAVESWVRSLPVPAEPASIAVGGSPAEVGVSAGRTAEAASKTDAPAVPAARDDVSSAEPGRRSLGGSAEAPTVLFDERATTFRYLAASLATLLGGAVLLKNQRYRPTDRSECVETPRRESLRDR